MKIVKNSESLLEPREVQLLLEAASGTASSGIRNRALIAVLHYAGLRIGEALKLTTGDLELGDALLRVRERQAGQRAVSLNEAALGHLTRWMESRDDLDLGGSDLVFCTLKGGPLQARYVRQFLTRLAQKSGIEKRVSPQALRDSRAAYLAAQQVPVDRIQAMLGHSTRSATSAYLAGLGLDATGLERWADTRQAQAAFPKLIRLLIQARSDSLRLVNFRAGKGVQLRGWDGLVDAESGNDFVPTGLSAWELGTGREVQRKADRDYSSRCSNPAPVDPKQTTFVFVTPRRWAGKSDWAAERRSEDHWADVRAYDADDLEHQLELAPAVGSTFARVVGARFEGLRSLAHYWDSYSATTTPPLSRTLVLGRQEDENRPRSRLKSIESFQAWLEQPPSVLELEADSPGEAMAFASAALATFPPADREHWESRGLIIDDPSLWAGLGGSRSGLLVVLPSGELTEAAEVRSGGNHVLIPLGRSAHQAATALVLPRLSRDEFELGIRDMGLPRRRAEHLARECARNLAVLQRTLAEAPSLAQPRWAQPQMGHCLVPALLAGAWDESSDGDKAALSLLAGKDYERFAAEVAEWADGADSPLRRVGSVWKLSAPLDAWLLLGRYLSNAHLERFRAALDAVLSEEDPRLELEPENRWAAVLHGKVLNHSRWLREGLAEGLGLLATFGDQTCVSLPTRGQDFANGVVRSLLAEQSRTRWASVSSYLPKLAEAGPDAFLGAVEDALEIDPSPLLILFTDEGFMGRADYSYLLWALETLAWHPTYLGRVAGILAQLAEIDPGGKYANRPSESLRQIFLPWLRQTSAEPEVRIRAIDMLVERHPNPGWDLLIGLLPKDHDVGDPMTYPRWRDWDAAADTPVTHGEWRQIVAAIWERTIRLAEERADRWHQVVENLTAFSPEHRSRIRTLLQQFAEQAGEHPTRPLVREAMREFIARHRQFPDADWSLPEEELQELEQLLDAFEPEDPVERYRWLFASSWPKLASPEKFDYHQQQKAIEEAQDEAVRSALSHGGADAVLELAKAATLSHDVGAAAGRVLKEEKAQVDLLRKVLGTDDKHLRDFGIALVRLVSHREGPDWELARVRQAQAESWSLDQIVDLFCGFRPRAETWQVLETLGSEVADGYWSRVRVFRMDTVEETETAIRGLLKAGRAGDAVPLAWLGDKEQIDADLVAQILEKLALEGQLGERGMPQWHEIKSLFEALEKSELDSSRLARLEWLYLEAVVNRDWIPRTLYNQLAADPTFFGQLVSWAFRAEGDDGTAAPDDGLSDEQRTNLAKKAYRLLGSWNVLPGTNEDGSIQVEKLLEWIERARSVCHENRRGAIGDERIGQMLAHAPSDKDGVWPAKPVRTVIEKVRSRDLESGFHVGAFNKRGVVSRGPGGDQERELAADYLRHAEAIASSAPRTSSVLKSLADAYTSMAERWDREHALRELTY